MPLPSSWTKVPVTGQFLGLDGLPIRGKVTFESPQIVVIDDILIVPRLLTVELDEDGKIPAGTMLPSTNDASVDPAGWAYTVRETWKGGRRAYAIFVPFDATSINLPTVDIVVPPPQLISTRGPRGSRGYSAYEVAVADGFVGTEAEWLETLVGPPGTNGTNGTNGVDGVDGVDGLPGLPGNPGLPGTDGVDGTDGKSAYQIALDGGFVGTESEWLNTLVGPPGASGEAATNAFKSLLASGPGSAEVGFQADVASPATRTLQSKAREIVTPADTVGGTPVPVLRVLGTPSVGMSYHFGDYNLFHAATQASFQCGGTDTQPNCIGKKFHRFTEPGNGVKQAFDVTCPFVVPDTVRFNIRAKKRRLTDGAVFIYSEGSGFTVTGYGTTTITVTMTAIPTATEELEVTVISDEDDGTANPQLIAQAGYDNVINSIMSVCFAAHCFIYAGNGHNAIMGGSFHRVAGSYNCVIAGTSCDIGLVDANSFGCVAFGQSVRVDGAQSFGFGANVRVRGTASGYLGRNGFINNHNDCLGIGYGGASTGHNQFVQGYGKSTDATPGLRQAFDVGLSIDTTSATQTYFTNSSGSSEVTIPPDSASLIRVDVVALRDDNTQAQGFSGQYLVVRVGSAIPTVDGSIADVAVPSVKSFGSAAWVCNIRGIVDGVRLRATGEAAKNVRWVGKISLVQTIY